MSLFNTSELVRLSGLDRNAIDNLRRTNILVQTSKTPVRWSYASVLLAKFIFTVQRINTPKKTASLLRKILEALQNQNQGIDSLFSLPFILFSFLDDGIFFLEADNTMFGEWKLVERFVTEKANITKIEKLFLPILQPKKVNLILDNVYVVYAAKLRLELDDAINALDDSIEQELVSPHQYPNTLEVAHRPLLR